MRANDRCASWRPPVFRSARCWGELLMGRARGSWHSVRALAEQKRRATFRWLGDLGILRGITSGLRRRRGGGEDPWLCGPRFRRVGSYRGGGYARAGYRGCQASHGGECGSSMPPTKRACSSAAALGLPAVLSLALALCSGDGDVPGPALSRRTRPAAAEHDPSLELDSGPNVGSGRLFGVN
jgi:hypothetical protein